MWDSAAILMAGPAPKDPFLAKTSEIIAMLPENDHVAQVVVEIDWIALPHAEANRLIREELKYHADAPALHEKVTGQATKGTARRVDYQSLTVRGGQKSLGRNHQKHDRVESYRASGIPRATNPQTLESLDSGRKTEVEASVSDTRSSIQLGLQLEWKEWTGVQSWGEGPARVEQPVQHECSIFTMIMAPPGRWRLVGMVTPPAHGVDAAALPMPDERVLVFVKASVAGEPEADWPTAEGWPKEASMLYEWIELEAGVADALLARSPKRMNAPGLRTAVGEMLAAGKGRLVETTFALGWGGSRTSIGSQRRMFYPNEFGQDQAETGNGTKKELPGKPVAADWGPVDFAEYLLGTQVEVEVSAAPDGFSVELNHQPRMAVLQGLTLHPGTGGCWKQPVFKEVVQIGVLSCRSGLPSLYAVSAALPPASVEVIDPRKPSAPTTTRLLHFVTPCLFWQDK